MEPATPQEEPDVLTLEEEIVLGALREFVADLRAHSVPVDVDALGRAVVRSGGTPIGLQAMGEAAKYRLGGVRFSIRSSISTRGTIEVSFLPPDR
jgi:hypothetical protein